MTVSEYLPFYNLFHNFDYYLLIDKEQRSLKEVFENYEDYELSDTQVGFLEFYDSSSLSQVLNDKYFTPENVVPYLRDLFDTYRENGGDPLDWLDLTFESINLNPTNYRAELRGTIEKSIVEWIDIFSKQPIDYLYLRYNPDLLTPEQTETKANRLKVPQIALIHIYEGIQITEENAKEIAAKHGYTAKTSGKGLYHDYLKYCKTSDRKAKPTAETKKTLINKIELFQSVVSHLSDKAKQKVNDEIKILNTILESEYR
jgi:hypothetical protein